MKTYKWVALVQSMYLSYHSANNRIAVPHVVQIMSLLKKNGFCSNCCWNHPASPPACWGSGSQSQQVVLRQKKKKKKSVSFLFQAWNRPDHSTAKDTHLEVYTNVSQHQRTSYLIMGKIFVQMPQLVVTLLP